MSGETAAAPGHARRNPASIGVLPEIAARAEAAIAIRHDLHQHPELAFEEHRTSARVAELLQQWGYEVTTGLGPRQDTRELAAAELPRALAA